MKDLKYGSILIILLISVFFLFNKDDKKSINKTNSPQSKTIDIPSLPQCQKFVVERWKKDFSTNSTSFLYERMINSKNEFLYFNTSDGSSCLSSL